MSEEASSYVADLFDRLTPSDEVAGQQAFYRLCQAQFGSHWQYADLTTVLWAASKLIMPTTYLEIGVRRGRSAAVIGATSPNCAIYGFDLWIPEYAGESNPGPDFVRSELSGVGHVGEVTLISGDSRETVPAFLKEHPDLFFDVITVDGDHSVVGAATDLANVLPRLKVGGLVAFDDICEAPLLKRVWQKVVKQGSRYVTWEYTDTGYGIAAAIRVGDGPLLEAMRPR
jgi:predicted O-methyltransferase YrrM